MNVTHHDLGDMNKHRYVIAAQSPAIRQRLRQVQAVPIVHVKRSVMVLEPISETTEQAKSEVSRPIISNQDIY